MDSSQVHENSQQVTHGEEGHHSDNEKMSVMNKVKAKARRITDSIKKHGQHVVDFGHNGFNNEDQQHIHKPGHDHDLDKEEDKEMVQDPQVHEAPIHESEVVKCATPASEQVENLGKSGTDFELEGTEVKGEESHQDSLVEGVSSINEINQNMANDPAKTFAAEENQEQCKVNLERPIVLEEDPHEKGSRPEAYTLPNYQTKITDSSEAGSDEMTDITPFEESFERMNVHEEPKHTTEQKIQPTVSDTEYPPTGSHDQFVPPISAATKTLNEYPQETISTDINRNPEIPSAKEDIDEQGSRPEAYTLPNYQTKVTDPSGAGSDEIKDTTAVEESFERMNVQDEPKPTTQPKIQPVVADTEHPPAGSHDPHLSAATKTQNEYPEETVSTDINRNPETPSATGETFNTITTTDEKQPQYESVETKSKHKSYTNETELSPTTADETYSPENDEASKLGYDEKGDRNDKVKKTHDELQESENASDKSHSLPENLTPVYEKDAEVGSAVKSKVYGTSTGSGDVETETKNGVKDNHDKGVPVKDYLAEKLRPGEEDKALSEVISEALHKPKEEPVKKEQGELGSGDEKPEKACEESYLYKVKGVVGSWFAKSEENQSPHVAGGEDLSKTKNSVAEVESVGPVVDEPRKQE